MTFGVVLVAWAGYVIYVGGLLPLGGNDALSYHLPRAVFFGRAHGFGDFEGGDPRLANWPANYELMLAAVLALDGSDRHIVVLSALGFVLFVFAAGALVERWNPRATWLGKIACMALAASAPVVLLHAGAVKNDLLTNFFFLSAFLALGSLLTTGSRRSWVMLSVSMGLALGTKLSASMLVVGVLVVGLSAVLTRGVSRPPRPPVLALAALLLTGPVVYVINLVKLGRVVGIPAVAGGAYGAWTNLWRFPYLLFTAPFSETPHGVWSFWTHRYWFWERYDTFSSQLGMAVSVLLLLVPAGILLTRGDGARERRLGSLAALVSFFAILPTRLQPDGFFCTFTRFICFVVPVIGVWTLVPLITRLPERWGAVVALLSVALFGTQAVLSAVHDVSHPLAAVQRCAGGGACAIRFGSGRACVALNQVAGPTDAVLMDADFDAWSYPCFGPTRGRALEMLPEHREGAVFIPPAVRWVVIDRMWNITWGHPAFTDFGHFFEDVGKGKPTPGDTALFLQLEHDPAFRRVFSNPRQNQALFERVQTPRI